MGTSKRVIMFGGAGTLKPVPPVVPGEERWGLNNLRKMKASGGRFDACTRWFDLHWKEYIISDGKRNVWGWYQRLTIPVYLWQTYPDLPTSVAYPVEAVRTMFGGTRLFTSSLDWQIALALYEGFEEIELYGFRMGHPSYKHQVGSGRWWLKQCAERGVKVTHLSPSCLEGISREVDFKPPHPEPHHLMYGLETTDRSKLYRGR
jgi:hypothetical protein